MLHAGNFGFLRDANSGEYLGPAPMFDFDHAFESRSLQDILIRSIHELQAANAYYGEHGNALLDRLDKISTAEVTPYMLERARSLRYNV